MGMQICTQVVSAGNSFVINASMGVLSISYQMSNGTGDAGTIIGNFNGTSSTGSHLTNQAITIPAGGGNNFSSPSPDRPIDGITLHCTQGSLNIILGY
jgi:hypothetical protein